MALAIVGIVVVIIVVLAIILVVNACRLKPTPVKDPLPPTEEYGDDAAVERFRELLRIPTVWDLRNPDADRSAFDDFIPKLKELYPIVFETCELETIDTYGISLLWKGKNRDLAPIVLMAHHDVVEASPEGWTHDPFAADIEDGKIYARGSVDTKCIWAALMESASKLMSEGYVPPRDVYFFSANTEEDGGDTTPHMCKLMEERGRVPYMVLDEGGAVIDNAPLGLEGEYAIVGVTEKGVFNTTVTTHSEGGHASNPSADDAPAKLVSGLDKLLENQPKAGLSEPVIAMLKELAAYSSFGYKIVFGNLWLFKPIVIKILEGSSETASMVRTTYALTQLEGSKAHNVLPKQAKATLNVRVDPNDNVSNSMARIKACFDDKTEYSMFEVSEPSPISPHDDDPCFEYIRRIVDCTYPGAGVAPYAQTSCSDSRHFAQICPHTYRFAGILFHGDQRARIHGQDENLDVDAFKKGVGFYTEFLRNIGQLGE